jgi:hypothetical protein
MYSPTVTCAASGMGEPAWDSHVAEADSGGPASGSDTRSASEAAHGRLNRAPEGLPRQAHAGGRRLRSTVGDHPMDTAGTAAPSVDPAAQTAAAPHAHGPITAWDAAAAGLAAAAPAAHLLSAAAVVAAFAGSTCTLPSPVPDTLSPPPFAPTAVAVQALALAVLVGWPLVLNAAMVGVRRPAHKRGAGWCRTAAGLWWWPCGEQERWAVARSFLAAASSGAVLLPALLLFMLLATAPAWPTSPPQAAVIPVTVRTAADCVRLAVSGPLAVPSMVLCGLHAAVVAWVVVRATHACAVKRQGVVARQHRWGVWRDRRFVLDGGGGGGGGGSDQLLADVEVQ